jgi:Na+/glutamate symporter
MQKVKDRNRTPWQSTFMVPIVGNVFAARINVSGRGYVCQLYDAVKLRHSCKVFLSSFLTFIFRPHKKWQKSF